ncbi:O-antigen polymerase [Iodobacter fluviatilis]|uniref:Oligosaccharide repeat unit polymerase n=1 Tax=Iodobacter fluviatilis TaxID=537 RepID=A0A377SVS5_9NEIS|nr:O-antigen polymerase [Iodobacter fluviatilis]TCU87984.1 oligosaccharide repeat unit polymerase [Iodobacter fluviatilis]STR45485.1 Uncharacterised protein [Iodobacter fluviatilis]
MNYFISTVGWGWYKKILFFLMVVVVFFVQYCVFEYSVSYSHYIVVLLLNFGLILSLLFICLQYSSMNDFLFSSGFWYSVVIVFYIILKSLSMLDYGEALIPSLVMVLVFNFFYIFGFFFTKRKKNGIKKKIVVFNDFKLTTFCFFVFVLFKVLIIFLMVLFAGDASTILEQSAATQNQGMAYLFRLSAFSTIAYYYLVYFYYTQKKFGRIVFILTLFIFVESIYSASRLQLVMLAFIHLFMFHRFVRPVSVVTLLIVSPLLIFIISYFGYVRNIEIGGVDVYKKAFEFVINDSSIIYDLFMARLDVLPMMVESIKLYDYGEIKNLWGGSYVYSILHFIPRGIWSDKPLLTAAYVTSHVYPNSFVDGVNIFPSVFIESFINLNYLGVCLIGLLIGSSSKIYDQYLDGTRPLVFIWALLFFTYPMGIVNEGVHSNYVANVLYFSFLYLVFIVMAKKYGVFKVHNLRV